MPVSAFPACNHGAALMPLQVSIKLELNEFKMHEMPVHADSRRYTRLHR
jgi:hypothetical protein